MTTRTLPLVLALGLFLAACGEDESPAETATDPPETAEEEPSEPPAETQEETAEEPAATPDEAATDEDVDLAVAETDLGEILVDGDGMTLYLFTEDPPDESVCVDDCLAAWPPLLVDGEPQLGDGVDPDLVATITREDDGSTQITYDGAPLYTWASDTEPGDVTGQDVQGVWFVVAPDGTAVMDEDGEDEDADRDPSY